MIEKLYLRSFIISLFVNALTAQPYYVSTTGNDNTGTGSSSNPWKSIGHALKSVPRTGGFDIIVKQGTYNGLIKTEANIDFNNEVTVRAENLYKSRLTFSGTNTVMWLHGSNYTFEGFEIVGYGVGHTNKYTKSYIYHLIFIEEAYRIKIKNNVIHDSYAKDLLTMIKSDNIIIEGNVFYNQTGWDEHVDVNIGSYEIEVRDNIFFNDFEGNGRTNKQNTAAFVIIKTSNEPESPTNNVNVRRNVFMNYQGANYHIIRLGEDDRYPGAYEAENLLFENNLFLCNGQDQIKSVFATWGIRNLTIRANTIAVTTPMRDFLAILSKGPNNNPSTRDVWFYNNILSDMTGTMDRLCVSVSDEFVAGTGVIHNNLLWNDGKSIPHTSEDDINYTDDTACIIEDPLLPDNSNAVVPRWNGNNFQGGYQTIREAFLDIVNLYGKPNKASSVIDVADKSQMPDDDIRGEMRGASPDIGAFEYDDTIIQYRLTINVSGNGTVSLAGGVYDVDTVVTLTANPDPGWQFNEWSGDLTGSTNPAQITMDSKKSVTASFCRTGSLSWQVIQNEDFESGWDNYVSNGSNAILYTDSTCAHQGRNAAQIFKNSGASSSFETATGLDLDTPGYTQVRIKFWVYTSGLDTPAEHFKVRYHDGTKWIDIIKLYYQADFSNDEFNQFEIILDEADYIFPSNALLRFQSIAVGSDDSFYIDEISISGQNCITSITSDFDNRVGPGKVIPVNYSLYAFPNPFNPSTNIQYSLPEAGHVELVVFDIKGCKVAELYNGFQKAGTYKLTWEAADTSTNLASSVYLLYMQGANYCKTVKMLFLK